MNYKIELYKTDVPEVEVYSTPELVVTLVGTGLTVGLSEDDVKTILNDTITAGTGITSVEDSGLITISLSDEAYTSAEKTKLSGVESGATVNSPDATLLDRDNHTGTQSTSTINGLDTALAGKAPLSHSHTAGEITSGTFADDRIAESNVTQHEGALTITESQISDLGAYITGYTVTEGDVTQYETALTITESQISDLKTYLTSVSEASVVAHEAALTITESQISDLGAYITGYTVTEGDVTQHEEALTITESQISDLGAYITGYTVTQADVTGHQAALTITESQISDLGNYQPLATVLTNTTASFTTTLKNKVDNIEAGATADQTGTEIVLAIDNELGDTKWQTGGDWGDIGGTLADQLDLKAALDAKAPTTHNHSASQITSGTFANARISEASVTQHEDALTITESQISDLGTYLTSAPVDSVAGKTGAVTLVKADVGLGNVDNTSDADKPVSDATQTALDAKANSSHTHISSQITDLTESVEDIVAALFQTGTHTNISVTYDDAAGTISLAGSGGGGLTQEQTEDIVAALVDVEGGGISITYDDPSGTLTFALTGESYTTAEQTKLSGISAGATVNDTDANLKNRANHTGTQAQSTITGLVTDLAGKASAIHNHAASDITSGTLANARISAGSVTQHQAAITITESQISDLGAYITGYTVTESDVTAHETALTITESQISDLGSYITASSVDTLTNKSGNVSQWTNDIGYITATLTAEQVQDYVGGMVTGNTETLINVTYQDTDGTLDFVVDDDLSNYDNSTSNFITSAQAPIQSVNTQTGSVVLDADDISDTSTTNKFVTSSDKTKLSNLSGTNTGDQTITLTGDVTGTGTGSFATTVTEGAVTQHEDALTITESQISDLGNYITSAEAPVQSVAGKTGTVTLVKADVGLGNVDNTSDTDKPISSATQTALDGKASSSHTHSYNDLTDKPTIPTNNNQLTNGAGFITDYTVTESDVTDHEGAITITESQISDLGSYLTSLAVSGLSDVTITSLSNDQVLAWNGTAWVNVDQSGGSIIDELGDINDVTITSLSTDQIIKWNGSAWVNIDIPTIAHSVENFTGDGSTTTFDLSGTVASENYVDVYLSGVYQFKNTYSIDGSGDLVFSTAPANGVLIEVKIMEPTLAGTKGDPGDDGLGVPSGGTTGQVLAKASGTDNDTEWVDSVGDAVESTDITNIVKITAAAYAALSPKDANTQYMVVG